MVLSSKKFISGATALLLASSCLLPAVSSATNGYFLIGFGTKSRGMGGVGVAEGVDGMAAAFNPATMANVGTRFDISGDFFYAPNAVTHSDGTLSGQTIIEQSDFENSFFHQNGIFLLPAMGATYEWDDKLTLGFAFIGAGMGTRYNQALPPGESSYFYNFNGLGGEDYTGIKLLQMQIPASVAYKIDKQHTVGASFVMAVQYFEAWGLNAFGTDGLNFAATTGTTSSNGTDSSMGAGFRLGYQGKFLNDDLLVGANYSSRVWMTEFEAYSSLFAEHGDFDIPENMAVGLAYKGVPDYDIKFDIHRINFSEVASVGNPGPYAYNSTEFNPLCPGLDPAICKLGGDLGMGFGWTNQTVYKIGVERKIDDQISVRAGYNYGKITIPADQVLFNMLAPGTIEKHLTLGATYVWDKDIELSVSYVHAFENTLRGPTLFQPLGSNPDVTSNNAAISMKQRSLGMGLAIKW